MQKILGPGMAFLCLMFLGSFQKKMGGNPARSARHPASASLIIRFRVYLHGQPMELNKMYRNPYGEPFELTRFRFYAGKISPVYWPSAERPISPSRYYLIDLSDSTSSQIEIPVQSGSFRSLEFQLGIDSLDQNRGAQTGALDPILGMFWTWNSGYLTFKMEGVSEVSDQPAHLMAYHIGGYRFPFSTVWKIKLSQDETIPLPPSGKIILEIAVELDNFFNGPPPLHIKETADCTTPGELARRISENFAGSFIGFKPISNP